MGERATAIAASDETATGLVAAQPNSASRTDAATTTTTAGTDGRPTLEVVQQQNNLQLEMTQPEEGDEHDEQIQLRMDPEQRAVWHNGTPSVEKGCADNTLAALAAAHTLSFVCSAPGCKALVDAQAARRKARAAGRTTYAPGDGCAGRGCSGHHRPGQFKMRQRKMAAALMSGGRKLIRWPATLEATEVWRRPRWAAAAAAEAALEAVAEPPAAPPPRTRARTHPIQ